MNADGFADRVQLSNPVPPPAPGSFAAGSVPPEPAAPYLDQQVAVFAITYWSRRACSADIIVDVRSIYACMSFPRQA
jgi:hypothetical protein